MFSDMNDAALKEAASRFGASIVANDDIYDTDAEIFAPCAPWRYHKHRYNQSIKM